MTTRGKAVEVLAYAAGLIDGEGHIGINYVKAARPDLKRKYVAVVSVGNTDQQMILWLKEEWGGYVFPKTRTKPENRPIWGWQINNTLAYAFLTEIKPYLRTKKRQAELLMQYWEQKKRYNRQIVQNTGNGWIVSHPGVPDVETLWRDNIVQQIRTLNHGQPQRLSETASRPEEAIV